MFGVQGSGQPILPDARGLRQGRGRKQDLETVSGVWTAAARMDDSCSFARLRETTLATVAGAPSRDSSEDKARCSTMSWGHGVFLGSLRRIPALALAQDPDGDFAREVERR